MLTRTLVLLTLALADCQAPAVDVSKASVGWRSRPPIPG